MSESNTSLDWINSLTKDIKNDKKEQLSQDEEKLRSYYVSELNRIKKDKNNMFLTQEQIEKDQKTLSDAKKFAEVLNSKKNAWELLSKQTKEYNILLSSFVEKSIETKMEAKRETKELQLEKDEEKAIIKYLWLKEEILKDINLKSAISVISSSTPIVWTTKEAWEKAWYKAKWFLSYFDDEELKQLNLLVTPTNLPKVLHISDLRNSSISIKDLLNTKEILKKKNKEEVLSVLFDKNSDWKVDKSDNWLNDLDSIYKIALKMEKDGKSDKLFKSISELSWVEVSNKEDLHKKMFENPELKYKFLNQLQILSTWASSGSAFVSYLLEYWNDATKKTMDKKAELEKKYAVLFETIESSWKEKYAQSLSGLEKELASVPDTDKNKKSYKELIVVLKAQKENKSFWDSVKVQWARVFLNLLSHDIWAWAEVSNKDLDKLLKEKTNDIVKSFNIDFWVWVFDGHLVPWIWASFDMSKYIKNEDKAWNQTWETKLFWKVWTFNLIPGIILGAETQTNFNDIKSAGLENFDKSAKYAWFNMNLNLLWWWAGLHFKEDKLRAIEQKEEQFSKFLGGLFDTNSIDSSIKIDNYINILESKIDKDSSLSQDDRKYFWNMLDNIKSLLKAQWFDSMNLEQKKRFINSIKTAYQVKWKDVAVKLAQEEWYEFSGAWIGIQFIVGFIPLPIFWASWSKIEPNYEANLESQVYTALDQITKEWKDLSWIANLATDASSFLDKWLDFEKNKAKFRRFAQKHPEDWRKFVKSLSFEQKFVLIEKMLKSDKDLKKDTLVKSLLEKMSLRNSINESEKMQANYAMAEFIDIVFADQRSIDEVILWFTKKNWKYEWTYDFIDDRNKSIGRLADSLWISKDFTKETKALYHDIASSYSKDELNQIKHGKKHIEQVKDPRLFAFVASYKIQDQWVNAGHSLGKNMLEIPSWVASIAWGKERPITNPQDKKYVIEKFLASPYSINTKKSLEDEIKKRWEQVSLDDKSFAEFLDKWELVVNWKTVKIKTDFVYFLYWQCANESMWLRISSLDFANGFKEWDKVDVSSLSSDGKLIIAWNTIYNNVGSKKDFAIWATLWTRKKEDSSNNWNSNNNWNWGSRSSSLNSWTSSWAWTWWASTWTWWGWH